LELTVKADPKLIQKLKVFSKKRNVASYDAAGNISQQDLEQAIKVANELQQSVATWLQDNYPKLLIRSPD
jgi:1,2-phenylacetyl-CoA epoxidase PaaB subunit